MTQCRECYHLRSWPWMRSMPMKSCDVVHPTQKRIRLLDFAILPKKKFIKSKLEIDLQVLTH